MWKRRKGYIWNSPVRQWLFPTPILISQNYTTQLQTTFQHAKSSHGYNNSHQVGCTSPPWNSGFVHVVSSPWRCLASIWSVYTEILVNKILQSVLRTHTCTWPCAHARTYEHLPVGCKCSFGAILMQRMSWPVFFLVIVRGACHFRTSF